MRLHSMEQPTQRRGRLNDRERHEMAGKEWDEIVRRAIHRIAKSHGVASLDVLHNVAPDRSGITSHEKIGRAISVIANLPALSMAQWRTEFVASIEDFIRRRRAITARCIDAANLRETTSEGIANPEQMKAPRAIATQDLAQLDRSIRALIAHRADLDDVIDVLCEQRMNIIQQSKRGVA
jgi:hypothetical protein